MKSDLKCTNLPYPTALVHILCHRLINCMHDCQIQSVHILAEIHFACMWLEGTSYPPYHRRQLLFLAGVNSMSLCVNSMCSNCRIKKLRRKYCSLMVFVPILHFKSLLTTERSETNENWLRHFFYEKRKKERSVSFKLTNMKCERANTTDSSLNSFNWGHRSIALHSIKRITLCRWMKFFIHSISTIQLSHDFLLCQESKYKRTGWSNYIFNDFQQIFFIFSIDHCCEIEFNSSKEIVYFDEFLFREILSFWHKQQPVHFSK